MEFDSIQMTLIAIFLASAVAMVVVCDFLRKTFFRPAVQRHGHGRHEHARASFESHESRMMRSSPGLSEFAMRSALPVSAEVISAEREPQPEPNRIETLIALQPPVAAAPSPLPESAVDAYLWEPPLNITSGVRGLISHADWQQAISAPGPFTGIAVAISINDVDGSMWHSPELMRSLSQDVAGLLGEGGFGCRTAYDEFLLVCPLEHDQPGRLKQVTMHLWNCQLRDRRANSVRMTWGGVDVRNQPLVEAIASATDRMRESQRMSDSIASAAGVPASGAALSCRPRKRAV